MTCFLDIANTLPKENPTRNIVQQNLRQPNTIMPQAAPHRTAIVIWRKRLGAASRIAVSCFVIGLSMLYGPTLVRQQVAYPAFAYVTAVLIVSEATLGDTLRGAWQTLIATSLVMGPSITTLWLIGPSRFTPWLAALAVAVGAFWVAMAESATILAKRIAFGQMVIVYVGTVVLGEDADFIMHPFHVAASTTLGAMSSILAMLIPFPRLANYEIDRKCKVYAKNAAERLRFFMKAIVDEDSSQETADILLLSIKSLSEKASRILHSVERYQDGMMWERPLLWLNSTPDFRFPADRLQEVEITLKGLEMVLASCQGRNIRESIDQPIKDELRRAANETRLRIEQIVRSSSTSVSSTIPELKTGGETRERTSLEDPPILFTLQCMNLLKDSSSILKNTQKPVPVRGSDPNQKGIGKFKRKLKCLVPRASREKVLFAAKCSLSLGPAVLLGLTYTKQNGYWSGLTIATGIVKSRQATFSVANARVQGTALGSVYGAIAYFICHSYGLLKLASLLPWIVFTTFLRHSILYGEPGGTSAIIGALLILGRKVYGTTTEFAIARLTEACIGLSCFIFVEMLLRPKRAAELAKSQASEWFKAAKGVLEEMVVMVSQTKSDSGSLLMESKTRGMKILVDELKSLVKEAKDEPNFWFMPFPGDCYTALLDSVARMTDALFFMAYSVEVLCSNLQGPDVELKAHIEKICVDIELFKKEIASALDCMEATMSSNDSTVQSSSQDTEMGEAETHQRRLGIPSIDREEVGIIMNLFLQHGNELTENLETRKQTVLSLGSIAFCMRSLVTETTEIGKVVKEIYRRENLWRYDR